MIFKNNYMKINKIKIVKTITLIVFTLFVITLQVNATNADEGLVVKDNNIIDTYNKNPNYNPYEDKYLSGDSRSDFYKNNENIDKSEINKINSENEKRFYKNEKISFYSTIVYIITFFVLSTIAIIYLYNKKYKLRSKKKVTEDLNNSNPKFKTGLKNNVNLEHIDDIDDLNKLTK